MTEWIERIIEKPELIGRCPHCSGELWMILDDASLSTAGYALSGNIYRTDKEALVGFVPSTEQNK